ncbi:peptide chain release factor 2 [Mycobacterium sp. E1747]|uniref:peptide chain release factor 2 n=1 Tax=Mycobacterium sp. E1747 TaxID=1834128 RepID=UPI000AEAE02A|nr:peptide chain release factor 2 [Mycobacterium sp. E1747]
MKLWPDFAAVVPEHEGEKTLAASLWWATRRYNCAPAPNGLALVQDFLNTRPSAVHGPDLLRDGTHAQAWANTAVWGWSHLRGAECRAPELTDADAGRLRQLRDTLDSWFGPRLPTEARLPKSDASVNLAWREGEVSWTPSGDGWRWFHSAIMGEVFISQRTGVWVRFKQCRNLECRATFFDRTWDMREIWHDARTGT